ncbi:MAG: response regulator [Proteobacteria bacterium]|nr:response regulator [Pseudomonadota bacterium]
MRILVIDDELTARTVAEILLTAYGRCDVADGGTAGLALFQKAHAMGEPYELITVDINMADMLGQEVVKRMRRLEEKDGLQPAKIVMVTGRDDLESMSASFWQGCQGYVVKPLTAFNLQEMLDNLYIEPDGRLE